MKKTVLLILLSLLTICPAVAQTNVVDQVVWVVGNEPILLSEVEEARIEMERHGQIMDDPYCSIPEQIAIQKLYIHQAELDSVDVSESYAIQYANEMVNQAVMELGSKENVEILYHRTIPQLREMYKEFAAQTNKCRA